MDGGERAVPDSDTGASGEACARSRPDVHSIKEQIQAQGDKVRALKVQAAKDGSLQHTLAAEIEKLKSLKAVLPPDELGESGKKRKRKGGL